MTGTACWSHRPSSRDPRRTSAVAFTASGAAAGGIHRRAQVPESKSTTAAARRVRPARPTVPTGVHGVRSTSGWGGGGGPASSRRGAHEDGEAAAREGSTRQPRRGAEVHGLIDAGED